MEHERTFCHRARRRWFPNHPAISFPACRTFLHRLAFIYSVLYYVFWCCRNNLFFCNYNLQQAHIVSCMLTLTCHWYWIFGERESRTLLWLICTEYSNIYTLCIIKMHLKNIYKYRKYNFILRIFEALIIIIICFKEVYLYFLNI